MPMRIIREFHDRKLDSATPSYLHTCEVKCQFRRNFVLGISTMTWICWPVWFLNCVCVLQDPVNVWCKCTHYCDVIMTAMASQITSLTNVYSIVYSGADQRIHQSFASLAFVRGIHRRPVNSPHKWPKTRKMFPFDDVIMIRVFFTTLMESCHAPCSQFDLNKWWYNLHFIDPVHSCIYAALGEMS